MALCRFRSGVRVASKDFVQTRRVLALSWLSLVWCGPYYEYVPVTSTTSARTALPPASAAPVANEADASGELPSTAETTQSTHMSYGPAWGALWFFPFFPIPPVDIGRGYDPATTPQGPGYVPRYEPIAPAYGPGGGSR
jgi:hypothetical protein